MCVDFGRHRWFHDDFNIFFSGRALLYAYELILPDAGDNALQLDRHHIICFFIYIIIRISVIGVGVLRWCTLTCVIGLTWESEN